MLRKFSVRIPKKWHKFGFAHQPLCHFVAIFTDSGKELIVYKCWNKSAQIYSIEKRWILEQFHWKKS